MILTRKLTVSDLDSLMSLLKKAVQSMQSAGIDQWDERYPARNDFADDIEKQQCTGLFQDNILTGVITLNRKQDPEYADVRFTEVCGSVGVIHRLCIDPDCTGRGLATRLIKEMESLAVIQGWGAIRLDTFSGNKAALALYDKLGYVRCGSVIFRKGEFICFEKILNNAL